MSSKLDELEDDFTDEFVESKLQFGELQVNGNEETKSNSAGDLISGKNLRPSSFSRPVLKPAFSEPVNVLSSTFTPPTPEDIGLGFYTQEGLSRSFYRQPPIGLSRRNSWHSQNKTANYPQLQFFSVRSGALTQAAAQCRAHTDPTKDGDMRGIWLLTQINHWDLELERLVLLSDFSILIFKYDFIALKPVHFTRLDLKDLTKAILGEIVYPQKSLVPLLSGIAGGVVSLLKSVLFPKLHATLQTIANRATDSRPKDPSNDDRPPVPPSQEKRVSFGTSNAAEAKREENTATEGKEENGANSTTDKGSFSMFSNLNIDSNSRCRDLPGLRLFTPSSTIHYAGMSGTSVMRVVAGEKQSTDHSEGVSWRQRWNPFCCSMPYYTLTSHPLYWYTQDKEAKMYDVLSLARELAVTLAELASQTDSTVSVCQLRVGRAFQSVWAENDSSATPEQSAPSCSKRASVTVVSDCGSSSGSTVTGSPYGKIRTKEDEEETNEDELLIENYLGLVSLLHNATHLGYFKMRGKISF